MYCSVFGLLILIPALQASSFDEWPGDQEVRVADEEGAFKENLSGLYYQSGPDDSGSEDVIWAVQNKPSVLFQLKYNSVTDLWEQTEGHSLHYPDGLGDPDAEDVTKAEPSSPNLYVCTEQDNEVKDSRLSVLLFRPEQGASSSSALSALQEWDLTADLKSVDHNLGLEAITWVPDSYLVQRGLTDDSQDNELYDPSRYPDHGSGLFFVGLEDNGKVYVYALTHHAELLALAAGNTTTPTLSSSAPSYTRITSFSSGFDGVMSLHFDDLSSSPSSSPSAGYLWAHCDDTCKGHSTVFALLGPEEEGGGSGVFEPLAQFKRPGDMPDLNNEGFTAFPESRCASSLEGDGKGEGGGLLKGALWSDDSGTEGHSLRQGTVPCGAFLSPSA